MGTYSTAGKNAMLEGLRAVAVYASIHTADPAGSGGSEASGGGYARVAVAFAAASGASTAHGSLTWNLPAGTFTHVGYWSAASGGTFYGSDDLATAQVLSSSGTLTITSGTADL